MPACWLSPPLRADDVRIVVMQFYEFKDPSGGDIKPIDGLDLPVAAMVDEMVILSGRGVASADNAGNGRTKLKIWIFGRALARSYFEVNGQRYYTVMAEARGIKAVIPLAFDASVAARADSVSLLGEFGDPAVVPDLIDVLQTDRDGTVRWQAAWSLSQIGDAHAVPALIDALNDTSVDVRWFASRSLRAITSETFGADHRSSRGGMTGSAVAATTASANMSSRSRCASKPQALASAVQ